MKKIMAALAVLAVVAMAMFTGGCNGKKSDAAKLSREDFTVLRDLANGHEAEKVAKRIVSRNPDGGKSTPEWAKEVGYRQGELNECVAKAYIKEFDNNFYELRLTGSPAQAEKLRSELNKDRERAKAYGYRGPFSASDVAINNQVIRVKEADLRNERGRIYNGKPRVEKVPQANTKKVSKHQKKKQELAAAIRPCNRTATYAKNAEVRRALNGTP